jgi:hypothetical protein
MEKCSGRSGKTRRAYQAPVAKSEGVADPHCRAMRNDRYRRLRLCQSTTKPPFHLDRVTRFCADNAASLVSPFPGEIQGHQNLIDFERRVASRGTETSSQGASELDGNVSYVWKRTAGEAKRTVKSVCASFTEAISRLHGLSPEFREQCSLLRVCRSVDGLEGNQQAKL